MGFLGTRVSSVSTFLIDRARYGAPERVGEAGDEVLFVLDGVGGVQFAPVLVRRALREINSPLRTVLFEWHCGPPGQFCTDLMWYRRNRIMGVRLARKLLAYRRAHREAIIHLAAFSGGAGIAVFALEALRGRAVVETLILAGPAVSPEYNLAAALRSVRRAYALVSRRDRWILGVGTRLFGTTDRRFVDAAGCVGFGLPPGASDEDVRMYTRLQEIRWEPSLKREGHYGGHTAWVAVGFLRTHLLPLLRGAPLLPTHAIAAGDCRTGA